MRYPQHLDVVQRAADRLGMRPVQVLGVWWLDDLWRGGRIEVGTWEQLVDWAWMQPPEVMQG